MGELNQSPTIWTKQSTIEIVINKICDDAKLNKSVYVAKLGQLYDKILFVAHNLLRLKRYVYA